MKIAEFKLERLFAKHEFSTKYLLSSSDCDGFSMKEVLDIATEDEIQIWEDLKLGYTESQGHPLLLEAISKNYPGLTSENIIIASPGELNFSVMNSLMNQENHVIAISPAYQSLHEIVKSIGCELSLWHPDQGSWEFKIEELQKLIRSNTKLIIINFPHNPTGTYLKESELQQIIEIARANNCYIYSDEMYHKLVHDMQIVKPMASMYEKGISLWGTSKSFGMSGVRIGWIACQDKELIDKIGLFKDYLSICSSAPSEILTLIALNHQEYFIQHNLDKIRNNLKVLEAFVEKHDQILSFIPPKAGTTCLLKLNIDITSEEFMERLIAKYGIMTVPAEYFDIGGKYIRIGLGRKNIPEVLKIMDTFLESFDKR